MRFTVTVEPADSPPETAAPRLQAIVEAPTREEALDVAETSYRLAFPRAGRLRLRAVREAAPPT
jgi:hypothetical protein